MRADGRLVCALIRFEKVATFRDSESRVVDNVAVDDFSVIGASTARATLSPTVGRSGVSAAKVDSCIQER